MNFNQYTKLTDILCYLTKEVTLKIQVKLNSVNNSTEMRFFHNEYNYMRDGFDGNSIVRNINCYFLIDVKDDFASSIVLRYHDIYNFTYFLETNVFKWYVDMGVYGIINNNLRLVKKYTPATFIISDYSYLHFIPIIIDYEDGSCTRGVRIFMSSKTNYIDISVDKLFDMYYIIKNVNVYSAATQMINAAMLSSMIENGIPRKRISDDIMDKPENNYYNS